MTLAVEIVMVRGIQFASHTQQRSILPCCDVATGPWIPQQG
jgi:hypothetical protein